VPAAATVNIFPTASLALVLALLFLFEGICWVDFQKRFQERASSFDRIGEQLDRKGSAEKDLQDLISGRSFGLIECQLQAEAESSAL
jgi:hypothetical protein